MSRLGNEVIEITARGKESEEGKIPATCAISTFESEDSHWVRHSTRSTSRRFRSSRVTGQSISLSRRSSSILSSYAFREEVKSFDISLLSLAKEKASVCFSTVPPYEDSLRYIQRRLSDQKQLSRAGSYTNDSCKNGSTRQKSLGEECL